MKDNIVWAGIDKDSAMLFYKRKVLPADPNAEPPKKIKYTAESTGKEVEQWIIKANAILGSKPVIIKKE